MFRIDAMGKACPIPVVETKKAIRNGDAKDGVVVAVDNEIATQNLTKMAEQLGMKHEVKKLGERSYEVILTGEETAPVAEEAETGIKTGAYIVAIGSDQLGSGDEELGKQLIGSFIYALTEQDTLPKAILFYNSGVKVSTTNEKAVEDLRKLSEAGVKVYSCGLCLNYYKLTEELKVGEVTNMYKIVEMMRTHSVVRP